MPTKSKKFNPDSHTFRAEDWINEINTAVNKGDSIRASSVAMVLFCTLTAPLAVHTDDPYEVFDPILERLRKDLVEYYWKIVAFLNGEKRYFNTPLLIEDTVSKNLIGAKIEKVVLDQDNRIAGIELDNGKVLIPCDEMYGDAETWIDVEGP